MGGIRDNTPGTDGIYFAGIGGPGQPRNGGGTVGQIQNYRTAYSFGVDILYSGRQTAFAFNGRLIKERFGFLGQSARRFALLHYRNNGAGDGNKRDIVLKEQLGDAGKILELAGK